MLVFYDLLMFLFTLVLYSNAMRDYPARTQLQPTRVLHQGVLFISGNTDEMGGSMLGILVNELCPNFVPAPFSKNYWNNELGLFAHF